MLEIITLQFMQKALAVGIFLGMMMSFLGVFVVLKKMSFFGEGVAHASLAGVALGLVLGISPFAVAVPFAILIGGGIYFLERFTKISSDSAIGVIFTTSMALGVFILSFKGGYQPDLMSFLFGNILTISNSDAMVIIFGSILIIGFLTVFYRQLLLLIIDPVQAWLQGVKTAILEFLFYIVLSLAVVFGVKMLGIVLVSALLVTPPTIAKMISENFFQLIILSIIIGSVSVTGGLLVSYYLNTPSGATIIIINTLIFILFAVFRNGVGFRDKIGEASVNK